MNHSGDYKSKHHDHQPTNKYTSTSMMELMDSKKLNEHILQRHCLLNTKNAAWFLSTNEICLDEENAAWIVSTYEICLHQD
jgi:hypothetical protein